MSYSVEELFRFVEFGSCCALAEYLKTDDPSVTELEIPEKYNGKPVVSISHLVFSLEEHLKSVKLPKSLEAIEFGAFLRCPELERVEFNGSPTIEPNVFSGCPKLSPETVVIGLVGSTDITRTISNFDFSSGLIIDLPPDCFRPDVFELLLKNNSFRNCDQRALLKQMTSENRAELFPIAEQYGLLENEELVEILLSYTIENQRAEITAYLLELKKRKFGFNGSDDFEL